MGINLKLNIILKELRQELETLYREQLTKIVLYGSQARGEANEESDIDIMVVLKNPISPGDEIFRMGEIKNNLNLKYDKFISIFPISEEDFIKKNTPLLENVRQEGILV